MVQGAYGDSDAIAAISTAMGQAALAIIRISGKACISLVSGTFSRPKTLRAAAGHSIVYGSLLDGEGKAIDEVLISVFTGERSFTGEESLEISCHGGLLIQRRILSRLEEMGIRQALPGEFSFRAFSNGKIDLTQAEAIMDLVQARSDTAREQALRRLSGELRRELEGIKEDVLTCLAATELYLDYSEDDGLGLHEDDPEIQGSLPQRHVLEQALPRIDQLLQAWQRERLWLDGMSIALAGAPNAGKSSLFNALLREERAIVCDEPGTTRDWLEAQLNIDGLPIKLIDTAGLREGAKKIEAAGIQRSKERMEEADLVLWLIDGSSEPTQIDTLPEELEQLNYVKLWTKADRAPAAPEGFIPISTKTVQGLDALLDFFRQYFASLAGGENKNQALGLASARQKGLLEQAREHLLEVLEQADAQLPLDLIAPNLHQAIGAIGGILGETSSEDILEAMFSKFCIGK